MSRGGVSRLGISGRRKSGRGKGGRGKSQRGAGLFSLAAAVPAFLLLLLFAVQLTVNLYARSQVTAHAYDAARSVAGFDSTERRGAMSAAAEARLRARLGALGSAATVGWQITDEAVSLRVVVRTPTVAPAVMRRAAALESIDRTITVRVEEPR